LPLSFIHFKQACDSVNRTHLSENLKELREPNELVNLLRMTLQDSNGKVKIQGQMTKVFGTEKA